MVRYFFLLSFVLCSGWLRAQEAAVLVGSGGGFAGTVNVYKITEKGLVFKGKGLGEIAYTECAKLKKSEARKIVAEARAQLQATPDFNHPGNIYRFIAMEDGGKQQRITWGDNQREAPGNADVFFQQVQSKVSALRFKPIPAQ